MELAHAVRPRRIAKRLRAHFSRGVRDARHKEHGGITRDFDIGKIAAIAEPIRIA